MMDRRALEIEADRILDAVGKAGVTMRLVGFVAILRRCSDWTALIKRALQRMLPLSISVSMLSPSRFPGVCARGLANE
jgi:hypothetical protein